MRWLTFLLIVLGILIFSQSSKALEYYSAGMSAYLSGDYDLALKWFEKALTLSPDIESYDPHIKLKMGISAFMIGDYDTARDLLKLYPNDVVARGILKIIEKGIPESEWEKWLMIPKESELQPSTPATAQAEGKRGKSPFLIFLGLFAILFSALMILELRFSLITSLIAKLPRIKIVMGKEKEEKPSEAETVVEITEPVEVPETAEEKEMEISFEEIMKAPLETVDKLIYGPDVFEEVEERVEGEQEEKEEKEAVPEEAAEGKEEEVEEKKAETESEKMEEEKVEKKEPSTSEIVQELVGPKEEESSEDDILRKSEELLKEIDAKEESVDLEETLRDVEELMEDLEAKEEYSPEDAEKMVRILKRLAHDEEKVM